MKKVLCYLLLLVFLLTSCDKNDIVKDEEKPVIIADEEVSSDEIIKETFPYAVCGYTLNLQGKQGFANRNGDITAEPMALHYPISTDEGYVPVFKNGKWGMVDIDGKEVIPAIYDDEIRFEIDNAYATVRLDGKCGVIDKSNNFIIEPKYDDIYSYDLSYLEVTLNGKKGLIDRSGNVIIEPVYENVSLPHVGDNVIGIRNNGKWGCADTSGEVIVEPKYDTWIRFEAGFDFTHALLDGKWGVINKNGETVVYHIYDDMSNFYFSSENFYHDANTGEYIVTYNESSNYSHQGLLDVSIDNKHGVINETGKVIAEFIYDSVDFFGDYYIIVEADKKFGLLNGNGEIILDTIYDEINYQEYDKSLIIVQKDGKCGLLDIAGKVILDAIYDNINDFNLDVTEIEFNGKWGIVNKNGEFLVEPFYEELFINYENDNFCVEATVDGKSGIIGLNGNVIIPLIYDKISFRILSKDKIVLMVEQSKKEGIIDLLNHRTLVEPIYDTVIIASIYDRVATDEELKYALIQQNGLYGLADIELGKILLEPTSYDTINPNCKPFRIKTEDGKYGYVNDDFEFIIEPIFDNARYFGEDGLAPVVYNGKWHFINKQGEFVLTLDIACDEIANFDSFNTAKFSSNEKYGLINKNGQVIADAIYDDIYGFEENGLAIVKIKDSGYGLIDTSGKIVLEPIYDDIGVERIVF